MKASVAQTPQLRWWRWPVSLGLHVRADRFAANGEELPSRDAVAAAGYNLLRKAYDGPG